MSKVLVRKAVDVQYPVAGPPILVTGGGGRRGQGDVRGTTKRERGLGLLGGAVGVLGAFGGKHRSLGSLVQSAISGGSQGRAIGRGLGRALTGRERQARADLREEGKIAQAKERARLAEATRARGQGLGSMSSLAENRPRLAAVLNPAAAMRRRNYRVQEEAERERQDAERRSSAHIESQRQVGDFVAGRERRRQEGRDRVMGTEEAQREMDRMRADSKFGQNMRDVMSAMGMSDEEIYAAGQQGGTAARQGQRSVRVEPAGPTPNVNAAGLPVQVIGPNTPMTALPAPSNPQDTAAGENRRMDDMGSQAMVAQGTDTARAKTVEVTPPQQQEGDEGMSEQQREAIERQMMQGRVRVQSSQPQDNMQQTRLDEFTE